jgi:hypothetical protein
MPTPEGLGHFSHKRAQLSVVSYCRTRGVVRVSSAVDLWSNSDRHTVRRSDSSTERSRRPHRLFEPCSYDLGTLRS